MKNLSPPRWVDRLIPGVTWRLPNTENQVFLTFDDGPVPGVTDWVLDRLAERNIRATFFCLGRNAEAYPHLLARIREEGHAVGNHTYSHLAGFATTSRGYYADVALANAILHAQLFRPPYGRIWPQQLRMMRSRFRVVLWTVLSMDYSFRLSPWECSQIVEHRTRSGDIIVFHDSYRAERNLRYALPHALDCQLAAGFRFAPIVEPLFSVAPMALPTPLVLEPTPLRLD